MISLLDCTLRDGGYLNDWDFGEDTIHYVVQRSILAGTELIEVGFLDERRKFDINRTIQPNSVDYDRVLSGVNKGSSKLLAMIDYGTCSIENIAPRTENTMLDGIRVIFKKHNKENAVAYAAQLMERGYLVSLQMVSITSYEDRDVLEFCDLVNQLNPYAVSIVDTYGLMHQEQMMHYFDLLNFNLNPSIILGYHAHNNFQLAYANSLRFLENRGKRGFLVDGTAFGMGKNAGNAPLELLMMYLNDRYSTHYAVEQILETIDACILPIYAKVEWGYKLRFFLSASNSCHPNYVVFLLGKKTLPVSAVDEILHRIPLANKLDYSKPLIEEMYASYQTDRLNNAANDEQFIRLIHGREVLLLGPGKSLSADSEAIQAFITERKPFVISVNCIPDNYPLDCLFISNSKRYSLLHTRRMRLKGVRTALTSNIDTIEACDYRLDVARYWSGNPASSDNALALVLNIMKQAEIKTLYLAGFDGFSYNNDENFYDHHLAIADNTDNVNAINQALSERISDAKETMSITFLTASKYETE